MTTANEIQHGGLHYKKSATLQHWDIVEKYGIGYCEGCSTKYVSRWREKNGLEDLQKAEHYVIKLLELVRENGRLPRGIVPLSVVNEFCKNLGIKGLERSFMQGMFRWEQESDLVDLLKIISEDIIPDAEQEIAGGK